MSQWKRTCMGLCGTHAARFSAPRSREEGNFELQVRAPRWPRAASRERTAARVTSLPASYGRSVLQNNGRNHILPSCPASQGLLRQTWKHNNIAGPSSCSLGGHGTALAAADPSLPSSSYCSAAATPGSHSCIYWHPMQIMASSDISNHRFSPPGKQQSKQLPHAELTRLWRKFTLHIIQLFACTWRLHTKPETPNLQREALFKIYSRTSGIQYSGVY